MLSPSERRKERHEPADCASSARSLALSLYRALRGGPGRAHDGARRFRPYSIRSVPPLLLMMVGAGTTVTHAEIYRMRFDHEPGTGRSLRQPRRVEGVRLRPQRALHERI